MTTTTYRLPDTYGYVLADGTAYVAQHDPFTALERITADHAPANDSPLGLPATAISSHGAHGPVLLWDRDQYGSDVRVPLPILSLDVVTVSLDDARWDENDRCKGCAAHIADPCSPSCPLSDFYGDSDEDA